MSALPEWSATEGERPGPSGPDHRGRRRAPRQPRHVGMARRGAATRPPAPG